MKNLDILPIGAETKLRLESFSNQYARFARILFEVLEVNESQKVITVKVEQRKNAQQKYQNIEGLINRTREMFDGEISSKYQLEIRAAEYKAHDSDVVNSSWLKQRLYENKMKVDGLGNMVGLEKEELTQFLRAEAVMSKETQRLMYFFFEHLTLLDILGNTHSKYFSNKLSQFEADYATTNDPRLKSKLETTIKSLERIFEKKKAGIEIGDRLR